MNLKIVEITNPPYRAVSIPEAENAQQARTVYGFLMGPKITAPIRIVIWAPLDGLHVLELETVKEVRSLAENYRRQWNFKIDRDYKIQPSWEREGK
jgi:hypothetical protein